MDRPSTSGHKDDTCNTRATLQYAETLKAHIQDQVFKMKAALKKAEHELCMQIDQQCRDKLQGLEYLCKRDGCGADCQNLNTQFNDNGSGFPKKSELDLNFGMCMSMFHTYGRTSNSSKLLPDFSKLKVYSGKGLKKEILVKESVKWFSCPDCFAAFLSTEALKSHYEVMHFKVESTGDKRGQFDCSACKMKLGNAIELNSHFTMYHGSQKERWFLCPDCSDKFPTTEALQSHYESIHTKAESTGDEQDLFDCSMCKMKLKSVLELNSHVTTHRGSNKGEQVESVENADREEDSEECFEFVDSVECITKEESSMTVPKTVDDFEEALERASCSSGDSFDVVPNKCCMNDSVCTNDQTLPSIVPLPKFSGTSSSNDDSPGLSPFYRENKRNSIFSGLLRRSQPRKAPALFSENKKVYTMFTSKGTASKAANDSAILFSFHRPALEVCTNASVSTTTKAVGDTEVLSSTSDANAIAQKGMCVGIVSSRGVLGGVISTSKTTATPAREVRTNASVSTTTEAVNDIEVIPSTSEANAIAPQEDASRQELSAASQDENNPSIALLDSFKPFLQKQDLKSWVRPNSGSRANSYADWVLRPAAPSNPLTELPNGSVSRDSARAFFKQL